MKNLQILLCLGLTIINVNLLKSQGQFRFPEITPPSPQASSYLKYGEVPVDYSTGVPKIEIPVYTIKSSFIEIPITFSYHSSGNKVQDIASSVGLGWVLNAAGGVTRTVLGRTDYSYPIQVYGPKSSHEMSNYILNNTKYGNYRGWTDFYTDSYSDRYSYYTTSFSGVFRLDFSTRKPFTVPYSNEIIEMGPTQENVKITDAKGNKWIFDEIEYAISENNLDGYPYNWFPSTYCLTKIINTNKTDSIVFEYADTIVGSRSLNRNRYIHHTYVTSICQNTQNACPNNGYYIVGSTNNWNYYRPKLLRRIKTKNSTTNFHYSQDGSFNVHYKLDSIEVKNEDKIIKRILLSHSYFGEGANARLKLDKVSFLGMSRGGNAEIYKINYNSTLLPNYYQNNLNDRFSEDFWGYYNGAQAQISMAPLGLAPTLWNISNDLLQNRIPNERYAKACIIESIEYPTKGKTLFDFESNYVSLYHPYSYCSDSIVGGLRIKKISNYSENGVLLSSKEFKYFNPYFNTISFLNYLSIRTYVGKEKNEPNLYTASCSHTYEDLTAYPIRPITNGNGSIVYYGKVVEYENTVNQSNGKTEYSYDSEQEHRRGSFFADSCESQFNEYSNDDFDQGTYVPQLIAKNVYSYNNGHYNLIYNSSYEYKSIFKDSFITGLRVELDINHMDGVTCSWGTGCQTMDLSEFGFNGVHSFLETRAVQDRLVIASNTETYFFESEEVKKTIDYLYDTIYCLPRKESILESNNVKKETSFYYPFDYSSTSPYDVLVTRNVFDQVIEMKTYADEDLILTTRANCTDWGNGLILPQNVYEIHKGSDSSLVYTINSYDNFGNICSYKLRDDLLTSVFWGYDNSYPVAIIKNSSLDKCAYQNFEEVSSSRPTTSGNWTMQTGGTSSANEKTGESGFYCASGTIIKSANSLNPGKYRLSFYIKKSATSSSYSLSCSGLSSSANVTNTDWSQISVEFSVIVPAILNATFSGVNIDDLRLCPSDAQMTTYTYEPLIGITSQTDSNSNTIYYEYDSFGRLKQVRDNDSKITSRNYYHLRV